VPVEAWPGEALRIVLDQLEKRNELPTLLGLHPLLTALIERRLAK
jgi:hypothetical protein